MLRWRRAVVDAAAVAVVVEEEEGAVEAEAVACRAHLEVVAEGAVVPSHPVAAAVAAVPNRPVVGVVSPDLPEEEAVRPGLRVEETTQGRLVVHVRPAEARDLLEVDRGHPVVGISPDHPGAVRALLGGTRWLRGRARDRRVGIPGPVVVVCHRNLQVAAVVWPTVLLVEAASRNCLPAVVPAERVQE